MPKESVGFDSFGFCISIGPIDGDGPVIRIRTGSRTLIRRWHSITRRRQTNNTRWLWYPMVALFATKKDDPQFQNSKFFFWNLIYSINNDFIKIYLNANLNEFNFNVGPFFFNFVVNSFCLRIVLFFILFGHLISNTHRGLLRVVTHLERFNGRGSSCPPGPILETWGIRIGFQTHGTRPRGTKILKGNSLIEFFHVIADNIAPTAFKWFILKIIMFLSSAERTHSRLAL